MKKFLILMLVIILVLLAGCVQKPERTSAASKLKPIISAPLNKYHVVVDKSEFAFAVFTYDENREFTVLVASFPCALGRSDRMTPIGNFEIGEKGRWKTWSDTAYSPYFTKYYGSLYFHGPLYKAKRGDSLIHNTYDEIGTAATSGCVRTTVAGSKWIYENCPAGTTVEIVASSNLVSYPGKPSRDVNYTNWDPTDPKKPSSGNLHVIRTQ